MQQMTIAMAMKSTMHPSVLSACRTKEQPQEVQTTPTNKSSWREKHYQQLLITISNHR
jgi:hypothetical protein